MGKTMFEKIWENHIVHEEAGSPTLLYIDLHLVHEVTSPQAFEGLRLTGRKVRRPDLTVATMDHNVPTTGHFQSPIQFRDGRWKPFPRTARNSASLFTTLIAAARESSTSSALNSA